MPIKGLPVHLIPISPNWHPKNCMTDSKENYLWKLTPSVPLTKKNLSPLGKAATETPNTCF